MKRQFTRQELYDLVWTEPTKAVAQTLDMSDVGLAKICRKANVPTPPRGYWARMGAGQSPPRIPLPPRFPGQSEFVGNERYQNYSGPDWREKWLEEPVPPVPVFDESVDELGKRARKMVGKVELVRKFTKSHQLVDTLLKQDEELRIESAKSSWGSYTPKYASGEGLRWLQIINSLFLALQRVGCSISMSTSRYGGDLPEQRTITVNIGAQHFGMTVGPRDRCPEKVAMNGALFVLKLSQGESLLKSWTDEDGRLETQLTDVVVQMLVLAELKYREAAVAHREWVIRQRLQIQVELNKMKAESERKRLEEEARRRKLQLQELADQAGQFFQARQIRAYVGAVVRRCSQRLETAEELKRFADWALAHADEIDPVLNGRGLRFVSDVGSAVTPREFAKREDGQTQ